MCRSYQVLAIGAKPRFALTGTKVARAAARSAFDMDLAPGRPSGPADLQQLIAAMARANATWGEERIAAELLLKLGLRISPRTVRRYMSRGGRPRDRRPSQPWSTFVRNHASAMLACDFFVTITASFRTLYVFVVWRSAHAGSCIGT